MEKIIKLSQATTLALHQSSFRTSYPKPTRLLLLGLRSLPNFCYVGPPFFDATGTYIRPLPQLQGVTSMRDRANTGPFKTTGTEQWPVRMCEWISAMLLYTCAATATTANEGQDADKLPEQEMSYPICEPEGHRLSGGADPAGQCQTLSGYK